MNNFFLCFFAPTLWDLSARLRETKTGVGEWKYELVSRKGAKIKRVFEKFWMYKLTPLQTSPRRGERLWKPHSLVGKGGRGVRFLEIMGFIWYFSNNLLQGENIDEETEYTKSKKQSDCKPYIEQLVNQCSQGNLDENAPPSLKAACGELQRILPLIG